MVSFYVNLSQIRIIWMRRSILKGCVRKMIPTWPSLWLWDDLLSCCCWGWFRCWEQNQGLSRKVPGFWSQSSTTEVPVSCTNWQLCPSRVSSGERQLWWDYSTGETLRLKNLVHTRFSDVLVGFSSCYYFKDDLINSVIIYINTISYVIWNIFNPLGSVPLENPN